MIDALNPAGVWAPFGPFSMAALQGEGQIVHIKGQVALDREGRIVGERDMLAQTDQALANIEAVLASFGGRMEDVLSLTQYVTDIGAFMAASEIRRRYFRAPFPVTATVQVAALYHPDLMVEIAGIAEIPRARFRRPTEPAI